MSKEALKQALDALEEHHYGVAQIIIREALAQPEQQPAQRKPLTDDKRGHLVIEHLGPNALLHKPMSVFDAFHMGIDAAESAHDIKE